MTVAAPAELARLLRARTLDLVVAEAGALANVDDLEVLESLEPLPAFIVTRAGHPLATRKAVELADVLDYPYAQVQSLAPRVLQPMLASRRRPATTRVRTESFRFHRWSARRRASRSMSSPRPMPSRSRRSA